jgi:hypothetical protein
MCLEAFAKEYDTDATLSGNSLQTVRLQLAKEAEAKVMKEMSADGKAESGSDSEDDEDPGDQDMTPGEFLFFGLEIEHQQCVMSFSITFVS